MNLEELRTYFDLASPDQNDMITIASMRKVLYDYAQQFGIELRIQEHLPSTQRVGFDTFRDYFLRNTTDAAHIGYQPSGQLRWRSNLPETSLAESTSLPEAPTEMLPPSAEENAVSMEMAMETLASLQAANGQITFGDFLRIHSPEEEGFRSLNLRI